MAKRLLLLLALGVSACVGDGTKLPCTADGRCLPGYECQAQLCVPCKVDECEATVVTLVGSGGGLACGPEDVLGRTCFGIPGTAIPGALAVSVTRTKRMASIPGYSTQSKVYQITPAIRLFDSIIFQTPLSRQVIDFAGLTAFRTNDPATTWTALPTFARPGTVTATATEFGFFVLAKQGGNNNNDGGPIPDGGAAMNPIPGFGQPAQINGGMALTGVTWDRAGARALVGDAMANVLATVTPPATMPMVLRSMANGPNGVVIDTQQRILVCEGTTRMLVQIDGTTRNVLVAAYMGQQLNGPLDVALRPSDGMIYFTDPGIGTTGRVLSFNGLFRVDPANTAAPVVEWQAANTIQPGGLTITADSSTLYVTDVAGNAIYAFDIGGDGSLGNRRMFATTMTAPRGLATDTQGNVYVGTQAGLQVFPPGGGQPYGPPVGNAPVGDIAFGGADARTLYGTAGRFLLALPVTTPGVY
ncbi:MAG: SMP-30/gluconolactonase/LRE family protein [Myxococcota bacterium]